MGCTRVLPAPGPVQGVPRPVPCAVGGGGEGYPLSSPCLCQGYLWSCLGVNSSPSPSPDLDWGYLCQGRTYTGPDQTELRHDQGYPPPPKQNLDRTRGTSPLWTHLCKYYFPVVLRTLAVKLMSTKTKVATEICVTSELTDDVITLQTRMPFSRRRIIHARRRSQNI